MHASGALAIWMDVDPEDDGTFDEWYRHQHLGERLSVPGFLRGRRYEVVGDGPRFFTLYDTATPEILASTPYLTRLNAPTEWTRRALPLVRRMRRNVYRRLADAGNVAAEAYLATARIEPHGGRGPHVKTSLLAEGLARASELPGVCAMAVYVTETLGTSVETAERRLVSGEVSAASPFLAVTELSEAEAGAALRRFWQDWGRAADVIVDVYHLLYGLGWFGPPPREA